MVVNGWRPARCRDAFIEWAHEAFQHRSVGSLGPLSSLFRGMLACLTGSLYPARGLEDALRRCFGASTSIDDCRSAAAQHGVFVAVTATTVPGAKPYLLSNYNDAGLRTTNKGALACPAQQRRWRTRLTLPAHQVMPAPSYPRTLTVWER